jgi:6-phosphogluconate dehydrogenase
MAHQIGFIGLGKMGKLMVPRLQKQGIEVVSYNRTPVPEASVFSIDDLVNALVPPRIVFLMISAAGIDDVISKLHLASGDTIIDGGNTFYKDSVRRYEELKGKGMHFIDCGTSGGREGAQKGACLMLGGDEPVVNDLSWLWDALAVKNGWAYFGPSGAGHFIKMIHNGIEYGFDQALGEGIEIISKSPYHIDLTKLTTIWNNQSIIKSYLVELLGRALEKDPELSSFTGKVGQGETEGWMLAAAREFGVEAKVYEESLAARIKSRTNPTMATKVVSALRREYGGHEEAK